MSRIAIKGFPKDGKVTQSMDKKLIFGGEGRITHAPQTSPHSNQPPTQVRRTQQ